MSNLKKVLSISLSGKILVIAALGTSLNISQAKPANALAAGGIGGAFSLAAYYLCVEKKRSSCELLLLDPPGDNITNLGFTVKYNPGKIAFDSNPTPYFFCDFSSGTLCPPTDPQSGIQPILDGNFIVANHPQSNRNNTSFTYTNDILTNTVSLNYDLSANPADASIGTNFFGLEFNVLVPYNAVQYFDQPGDYDISFENTVCTNDSVPPTSCGSPDGRVGVNFIQVPEPSSLLSLLIFGTLGAASTLNRKLKPSKSSENETTRSL